MMDVVSYVQGTSVRRFSMEEVQPPRGVPYNTLVQAIKIRYAFQNVGVSLEAQQRGIISPVFERAEFLIEGAPQLISGLEFTSEGLRVVAYTTEVADVFIADLINFAEKDFGYRIGAITKPAMYASTLLVKIDNKPVFEYLENSAKLLEEEFALNSKKRTVKPFGIRLMINNEATDGGVLFVFEKRVGPETGEDIYFSQAPLPSASHERFLKRLWAD